MTSLFKKGGFFPLAILSLINPEIISKRYRCTLKMILTISDNVTLFL